MPRKGNKKKDDKKEPSESDKIASLLDSIISVYPKMKDDKQFIINKLMAKNKEPSQEYILDKLDIPKGEFKQDRFNVFTNKGEMFYVDPHDNIINSKMEIVGIQNRIGAGARFLFFNTKSTMPDKIP